jgi:hypothetical protein
MALPGAGTCRVCGEPARDVRAFYCAEHVHLRPPPKKRKRAAASSTRGARKRQESPEIERVTIQDLSGAATEKAGGDRGPTPGEWAPVVRLAVTWSTDRVTDRALAHRVPPEDAPPEAVENFLALRQSVAIDPAGIKTISAPLSRLLADLVPATIGRAIVGNIDAIFALMVLSTWWKGLAPFRAEQKELRRREAQLRVEEATSGRVGQSAGSTDAGGDGIGWRSGGAGTAVA